MTAKIKDDKTGREYQIKATCRHCGQSEMIGDVMLNFKVVLFDSVDGHIICCNKECDALDDHGVWLSVERV